jgi:hypothetical protein
MPPLLIKSVDRTAASTSSSNFQVELPYPIEGEWNVQCIQMPYTLYSVVAGLNDTVYTSLGNATLTAGSYSTSTFTSMLQTRLQVADANFTATYNTDTKKMTITNTGAFTLNFATTTASAAKLCGFTNSNTGSATSQTGTLVVDLVSSPMVLIEIAECKNKMASSDVASHYRGNIYVPFTVAFGSYERLLYGDIPQSINLSSKTKLLTFKLWDSDGNVANLNGSDWQLLLSPR